MNKKILAFSLLGLLAIGIVSAIGYYALFSVNVNIIQPISWDDNELEQIVENCEAGTTCLGDSITISNSANNDRVIKIVQTEGDENIEVNFVGKLVLSKKDISDWSLIGEPTELTYTIVGEEFYYDADLPDGYVLIYYKDAVVGLEGRMENPQPIVVVTNSIGDLPQSDDANLYADYSEAPDFYEHKIGAKLWAVPSNAILEGNVLDWSQMSNFLYETDLIWSFANSENEITIPANSFITFYPSFTPSNWIEEGEYNFEFEIL